MTSEPALRVVSGHQPNFFPWLGFFDKLARADVFLIGDNMQMPRTSSWVNRVRLMINAEPKWVTMPVRRRRGQIPLISEIEIDSSSRWRRRAVRSIELSYEKAPYFSAIFPFVVPLVENPTSRLLDYNLTAIKAIAQLLELDRAEIILGSSLNVEGKGTDLVVAMVSAAGGSIYLHGTGARAYQDDAKFAEAGISLLGQSFEHPVYPQGGTQAFVPGLSIIDTLMNCGVDRTRRLVSPHRQHEHHEAAC